MSTAECPETLNSLICPTAMDPSEYDLAGNINALFDADNYLYFNLENFLTEQRTEVEVQFIRDKLGINGDTSLLDLACGHGRHANALAKQARLIAGLDTNARFLQLASEQAAKEGLANVTFIQKDIRQLDYLAQFERATLLNTVFGLFCDAENNDLLLRINRALKTGGKLCLDVVNRDTVLRDFQPDYVLEKDGNLLIDRCSFNERTGRMRNRRIYIKDGRRSYADFSLRLYNYSELSALLTAARFELVDVYADWHAAPMDCWSKKIVVIARKIGAE